MKTVVTTVQADFVQSKSEKRISKFAGASREVTDTSVSVVIGDEPASFSLDPDYAIPQPLPARYSPVLLELSLKAADYGKSIFVVTGFKVPGATPTAKK